MMPRRGAGMRMPFAPGAALAAAPVMATAAAMPVVAAKNWRRLRPSFVTSFSGLTSLSLCIVSAPSGSDRDWFVRVELVELGGTDSFRRAPRAAGVAGQDRDGDGTRTPSIGVQ